MSAVAGAVAVAAAGEAVPSLVVGEVGTCVAAVVGTGEGVPDWMGSTVTTAAAVVGATVAVFGARSVQTCSNVSCGGGGALFAPPLPQRHACISPSLALAARNPTEEYTHGWSCLAVKNAQ